MRTIIAWMLFFYNCTLYLLHRARLRGPLDLRAYTPWWEPWLGSVFRWRRTLRIRGMENCPRTHPILVTGNHVKLEDPFCHWVAVYRATDARISPYFLMRDDFFQGKPWDWLPIDMNEIARAGGGFPISRGKISLAQLRPILNTLCAPASIIMFPGRTRTRTGLVIEYPEGLEEPGSPAFLMAQVSRRSPELNIALLPICRTWNPVTGGSVMHIGAPRYLPPQADRNVQRALDHQNLLDIANLIEVHAPHLVALTLYLFAHHAPGRAVTARAIGEVLAAVLAAGPHPFIDPALTPQSIPAEVSKVLQFFHRAGMITRDGGAVTPNAAAIRRTPVPDPAFRRKNPVQFLVNQVLHLRVLCETVEEHVLCHTRPCG